MSFDVEQNTMRIVCLTCGHSFAAALEPGVDCPECGKTLLQ